MQWFYLKLQNPMTVYQSSFENPQKCGRLMHKEAYNYILKYLQHID